MISRSKIKPRQGYSLTELAIVLSIVGVVVGGIWQIATTMYESVRSRQAVDEITVVVNNIRGAYAARLGIPQVGLENLSSTMLAQGIIPPYMQRTPATGCTSCNNLCPDTPWGFKDPVDGLNVDPAGTFRVCDWDVSIGQTACNPSAACLNPIPASPATQYFAVLVRNIPIYACMNIAAKITNASAPAGLYDININGCNIVQGNGCAVAPTPSLPVKTQDLNLNCNKTNSDNILRLVYRLQLPNN